MESFLSSYSKAQKILIRKCIVSKFTNIFLLTPVERDLGSYKERGGSEGCIFRVPRGGFEEEFLRVFHGFNEVLFAFRRVKVFMGVD